MVKEGVRSDSYILFMVVLYMIKEFRLQTGILYNYNV